MTIRALSIILPALLAIGGGTGFAQPEPLPLQEAEQQEQQAIRGIILNGVTDRPTIDMYGLCTGLTDSAHGYVDTDHDQYADTLRQFGAAMVSAEDYRRVGARVLGALRNQATLRAQSSIAQSIEVVVAVNNGLSESFSTSTDLGAVLDTDTYEEIRAQATEIIRGATVTGTRLVSLPGEGGICLVVRYDVPLRLNGLDTGRTVPVGGPNGASGDDHELPPPGVTGNF